MEETPSNMPTFVVVSTVIGIFVLIIACMCLSSCTPASIKFWEKEMELIESEIKQ